MAGFGNRSHALLPCVLAAVGLLVLRFELFHPSGSSFVLPPLPKASKPRGKTTMYSFKEDFDMWRNQLSPEEREMLATHGKNTYNKKYRRTHKIGGKIAEEKHSAFTGVLGKYLKDEFVEQRKKQGFGVAPDYDAFLRKSSGEGGGQEVVLKRVITAISRKGMRMKRIAEMMAHQDKKDMKDVSGFPGLLSSPFELENGDAASNAANKAIVQAMREGGAQGVPDVPPTGAKFKLTMPDDFASGLFRTKERMDREKTKAIRAIDEDSLRRLASGADPDEVVDSLVRKIGGEIERGPDQNEFRSGIEQESMKVRQVARNNPREGLVLALDNLYTSATFSAVLAYIPTYYKDLGELEKYAEDMALRFKSQENFTETKPSKADVMMMLAEDLAQSGRSKMAPLDSEALSEFRNMPAIEEGRHMHNWGWAETLFQSAAEDPFGNQYLLGLFEHEEDAEKAYDEWNLAFNNAQQQMADDLVIWSRETTAYLDADDGVGPQSIRRVLTEARAGASR